MWLFNIFLICLASAQETPDPPALSSFRSVSDEEVRAIKPHQFQLDDLVAYDPWASERPKRHYSNIPPQQYRQVANFQYQQNFAQPQFSTPFIQYPHLAPRVQQYPRPPYEQQEQYGRSVQQPATYNQAVPNTQNQYIYPRLELRPTQYRPQFVHQQYIEHRPVIVRPVVAPVPSVQRPVKRPNVAYHEGPQAADLGYDQDNQGGFATIVSPVPQQPTPPPKKKQPAPAEYLLEEPYGPAPLPSTTHKPTSVRTTRRKTTKSRPVTTPRPTTTTKKQTRPTTTTARPTTAVTTPKSTITTTTPKPTTTAPTPTTTTPKPTTTTPKPTKTTTTPRPTTTTTTARPTTSAPKTTTTARSTTAVTEYAAVQEPVYDETYVGQYYYGKKGQGNDTFPLPSCFYNPSGYVCCNLMLNELMVASFENLAGGKKFNKCNVQKIANSLQVHSEKIFSSQFETIVSYEDFSQKIHFRKDLVCKVEVDGRFILAYATPESVEKEKIIPTVPSRNIVKDPIVLKQIVKEKLEKINDQL